MAHDPSNDAPDAPLRRTALHDLHLEAGGRMVPFAGWEMPVQYSGVIEEHRAVRTAAGLFDVSHMGEFDVRGAGAEEYLQYLTPNDVSKLRDGRAHYSALLTEAGTYIDDVLIYRFAADHFMIVVNASNEDKDFAWVSETAASAARSGVDVRVENVSSHYSLLALQGPKAVQILATLTSEDLDAIRYYRFVVGSVADKPAILSRTGYTGEDGFELYIAPEDAPMIWRALLAAGAEHGLIPTGLGARDTLRLEAGMALYGHEIDDKTTPVEARLMWAVKPDKGDFIGRKAILEARDGEPGQRLVGYQVLDRGIGREGYEVIVDGAVVGRVTSGTWSPTFEAALGMAYVPAALAEPGTRIGIKVRKKVLAAEVRKLPFYKRPKPSSKG